jgi:hypothetical protein
MMEQSVHIVVGFASACAAAVAEAIREVTPETVVPDDDDALPDDRATSATGPSAIGLATGAAAGLTVEVAEAAVRAFTSLAHAAGPMLSWLASPAIVRRGLDEAEDRAHELNERWTKERGPSEAAATAFAGRLVPEITNAILDQVDLTQLAIDRIDIDRIVETIDLDQIIDRIDIDAIVARVDVNAIIDRVDLVAIADDVIGQIDLPELIRESTGAVTSETVRSVRMQSAEADLLVSRTVDRVLMRRKERQTGGSDGTGS